MNSPEDLGKQLESDKEKFTAFRSKHGKLTKRLKQAAQPFVALLTVASSAISLSPFAPASTIFGAVVYIVKAANGVSEAYDWIDELFDKLGDFTVCLDEHCKSGISPNLAKKVVQILGCMLEIFAQSEKTVKTGRWKKYAAVVFLGKDDKIKASFDKLTKLLGDEQRLVTAIIFATNQTMNKRVEEIHQSTKQTLKTVENVDAIQQNQLRDKILKWISSNDFPERQSDILNRRQRGTGQWFLNAPQFTDWAYGSNQTMLCPGIPGAGKTVMAAIAIDYLSKKVQSDTNGLAYIYCDYTKQNEQDPTTLLSKVIRQLLQVQQSIPKSALDLHEHHSRRGTRPSLDEIFDLLQSIIQSHSSVHLVIDALDECLDPTRGRLLSMISALQKGANVKLMVTSRFDPNLEEFDHITNLEVRTSDDDVKTFVNNQVPELRRCVKHDKKLLGQLEERIVEAADGAFLLARLLFDLFRHVTTVKQAKDKLDEISKMLQGATKDQVYDKLYDEAIKRIERQSDEEKDSARKALSWLTYAERTLIPDELCHALAVDLCDEDLNEDLNKDNIPDMTDIVSFCAGLVIIDETSNVIRLVHYTTQEYFRRVRKSWIPNAQQEITSVCIAYLSFRPFRTGPCDTGDDFRSRQEKYKLLNYASRYWGNHAQTVQEMIFETVRPFLMDDSLVSCTAQTRNYYFPHKINSTGLHLTAGFGLPYLSKRLSSLPNVNFNSKASFGETPLPYAAKGGHGAIAELLIANGADIEAKNHIGQTPLLQATEGGHEAAVELLLAKGADIEAKDNSDRTPLSDAAMMGHQQVVELLIQKGADTEAKNNIGLTPLLTAALRGHESVAEPLVKIGADIEAKDIFGRTPLSIAAIMCHQQVVELLLAKGADIEVKDDAGQTPLSSAMKGRHEAVVELLLARRADPADVH